MLVICSIAGGFVAAAEPVPVPEHQMKALYLFNFTKYVEWPGEVFAGTNACYTIGIFGAEDTYNDLQALTSDKTVNGRKLVVKRIAQADDAKKCHIVYLGRGSEKLETAVLETVRQIPVLTVGEHEDFLSRGGMVRFAREQNKLRVEIDLEASQKAHLTVSARLVPIAKVIRGRRTSSND